MTSLLASPFLRALPDRTTVFPVPVVALLENCALSLVLIRRSDGEKWLLWRLTICPTFPIACPGS